MLKTLQRLYKKPLLVIFDLLLINIAFIISFYLRFDSGWVDNFQISYLVILSIISFFVLYFSGLYNKIWRYASISELISIIKVAFLVNLLMVTYIFLLQTSFSRTILVINGVLDVFFLGGVRFFLRVFHDYLKKQSAPRTNKNVLLVGAGDAAEMIIREMQKHPELGKEVIGLVDDDPDKSNLEIHGCRVLGNRYDIPQIIKEHNVMEVIIVIPSARGDDIKDIYNLSNKKGVHVKIVPGMYEIINGDVSLSQIREVKVEDLLRRDSVNLNTREIAAYLQGKTVLVTGAGGSIGSEICRQIVKFGPQRLILLDIYENDMYFLKLDLEKKYSNIDIHSVVGSIRDQEKLHYTFAKYRPEVVFHAAAHKHVPLMENNPEEAVKNNILGTRKLVEIADDFSVNRFVFISTDKAVNPTNVMGASKRAAEMIIQVKNRESDARFMAVRFGNVLGSSGSVIPWFKKQIRERSPVTVTHPEVKRYFMTIPEAAQLVIQAGSLGNGGEVYVLDMGEPVKIYDLAEDLIRLSGLEPGEDIDIEITGLRPGEKLYEELLHEGEKIATDHEKIFITRLEPVKKDMLEKYLDRLHKLAEIAKTDEIINCLQELVDTYQPNRENVEEIVFDREYTFRQKRAVKEIDKNQEQVASSEDN